MACGAVWLKRRKYQARVRDEKNLKPNDELLYHYAPELLRAEPPELKAIHLDPHFSVWLKPRDMTISGSRFCDHTSLKRCVETQHPTQAAVYVVHRLDRFTTGLIVVAHDKETAAALSAKFRDHEIEKVYHARVKGVLTEAAKVSEPIDDKPAFSEVSPVAVGTDASIVAVVIKTGRKHQVRRHLMALGHPVTGDRQYGDNEDSTFDLQLAATLLAFELNGERFSFELDWRDCLAPV